MLLGVAPASDLVGFPREHSAVFQRVADSLDVVILSRAVGRSCTQLIEEGYGLKGFRIDTKSCSWGPQMGLVCVDPRLNKEGAARVAFTITKTREAMSGHVPEGLSVPAGGEASAWVADTVPIAISGDRLRALMAGIDGKRIAPTARGASWMRGESRHVGTGQWPTIVFPWRLIRLPSGTHPHFGEVRGEVWGLFVDERRRATFDQAYPDASIQPRIFRIDDNDFECVLGLANPGTGARGYKACVTGDYDLFGVWPRQTIVGGSHNRPTGAEIHAAVQARAGRFSLSLIPPAHGRPMAPRIPENWDVRPKSVGQPEHWALGNISQRINLVKVMLNTQLQADRAIPAFGQCVHHSDEVGNPNPQLMKSLEESIPVIAFIPRGPPVRIPAFPPRFRAPEHAQPIRRGEVVGVETMADMKRLAYSCNHFGYSVDLRPNWRRQLAALP